MKLTIHLCIISFLVISCSDKNTNNWEKKNYEIINVPLKNKKEVPVENYSDFIDSVKYFQLEYSDSNIIGYPKVSEIYFIDNELYVADNKAIYIYDNQGLFLRKISRKGRGRGEYLTLTHFDVNPINKEISILDEGGRCIYVYTNEGRFISRISLGDNIPRDFAVQRNGDYLFFTPDKHAGIRGLWNSNAFGQDNNILFGIDDNYNFLILLQKYFSHINDSTIGLMGIEDNNIIYHINDNCVVEKFKVTPDMSNPAKYTKKDLTPELDNEIKGKMYFKAGYVESERFLKFNIALLNTYGVTVHYDKIENKTYYLTGEGTINFGEKIPMPFPVSSGYNNVAIGYANPEYIEQDSITLKIFPKLKTNTNPCIALYYLKK